jgi:hypothetical protein
MSDFPSRSTEMRSCLQRSAARLGALSRDERGTISLLSVVTIFVLTIVLGMVINAGRNVDEKVRMQSAADAASYSGGVVIARGLNALAFTNHLEAEIFALTAYMRAARDAGPDKDPTTLNFENSILDAWNTIGGIFARSSFPKFAALGPAIQQKVPLERDLVKTFLQMSERHSLLVLPALESILGDPNDPQGGVIPRFQRMVVLTTPQAAQMAAGEVARMHGSLISTGKLSGLEKLHGRQPLSAVFWRTNVTPIATGSEQAAQTRTLPVVDPSPGGPDAAASGDYLELAQCQRRSWAHSLRIMWNQYLLNPFYRGIPAGPGGAVSGKMSSLYWIWDIYTCGQLNKLLDDYRGTNLPYVFAVPNNAFAGQAQQCQLDCNCVISRYQNLMLQNVNQQFLEQRHTFIGVVYWPWMQQKSPVFFRYPLATDSIAFAQTSVFIPKARFACCPWYTQMWAGAPPQLHSSNNYENWPPFWDLTNQNWIAKLVPATSDSVAAILQSPQSQQFAPGVRTPNFGGLSSGDLRTINTH